MPDLKCGLLEFLFYCTFVYFFFLIIPYYALLAIFFFVSTGDVNLLDVGRDVVEVNERRSGVVVAGSVAMECPADRVPRRTLF